MKYKVLNLQFKNIKEIEDILNELAAENWNLVTIQNTNYIFANTNIKQEVKKQTNDKSTKITKNT